MNENKTKHSNKFSTRLSDEQVEKLELCAKERGLSKTGYIRYLIDNPINISYDSKNLLKYSMELEEIRYIWYKLIHTQLEQKIVFRSDIIAMSDAIQEMQNIQKRMLRDYRKQMKINNDKVDEALEELVREK